MLLTHPSPLLQQAGPADCQAPHAEDPGAVQQDRRGLPHQEMDSSAGRGHGEAAGQHVSCHWYCSAQPPKGFSLCPGTICLQSSFGSLAFMVGWIPALLGSLGKDSAERLLLIVRAQGVTSVSPVTMGRWL